MSPIRMERIESGARIVIAFNEAFNRHDVAAMMQLVSDDCIFEDTAPAPDGAIYKGKEAVTRYWQSFFTQSTHAHIKIEETISLGFRCIVLWRYDWVDLTGNPGQVRGVDIFRVQNGLITEKLSYVKG